MTGWLVILAIGLGSYVFRASMFVLLGDRELPAWTTTPMTLVAPAAIGAMVVSMTLTHDGRTQLPALPELAAMVAGFVVVRRTGNVMHAITVGLPVFWLVSAIV